MEEDPKVMGHRRLNWLGWLVDVLVYFKFNLYRFFFYSGHQTPAEIYLYVELLSIYIRVLAGICQLLQYLC